MRLIQDTLAAEVKSAPRLLITGRNEVLLERHAGLFSYETKCIRARTREGVVTVTGENLTIAFFGAQDMLIQGRIAGVQWENAL